MTSSLHEYEAWLDKLDNRFYIKNNQFIYNFDEQLLISLDECKNKNSIKKYSRVILEYAERNKNYLPKKYLIQRFVRLVVKYWSLNDTTDEIMNEINTDWGGYNELTGGWNT
ncbi:hypothetical protein [Sulfuricurvum sp.]|uniref:hypothetical protein n=1 Tax=Sulfuricurvum sp. TaxID=2025608 RepID=UPI002E344D20|nr:hypothetical protein [Sulfuricurvum sp.]HEX5328838.1 hypothetical protein [Sulfuricurvum sp.]